MRSKHRAVIGCLLLLVMATIGGAAEKMDRLIVYGDGFAFGVKEPAGWMGDTNNAGALSANIVFYRNQKALKGGGTIIQVRINDKVDEDTEKDLQADMDGYRKEYPQIRFEPLAASHPQYRCLSKAFILEGKLHEYVAYLNPGEGHPLLFSVSLNTHGQSASAEELAAFRSVVSSLVLLNKKPGQN